MGAIIARSQASEDRTFADYAQRKEGEGVVKVRDGGGKGATFDHDHLQFQGSVRVLCKGVAGLLERRISRN